MKVLFIGGTGNISTIVSQMAVERGIHLTLLNRGKQEINIPGVRWITADIHNPQEVETALAKETFDVVVNWIAFTPQHVQADVARFLGKVGQYIFISSASCYQKPPTDIIIRESTPLHNPYWLYSRDKIDCENLLMQTYREQGFPVTIVRPSHTYDRHIPVAIGGWDSYTLVDRMLRGAPVIVHGDGSSLWAVTHAEDFSRGFLGLLGHPRAIGQDFHITSDERLTWNDIYTSLAAAVGVKPNIVHIATDFIIRQKPEMTGGLLGDKSWSVIFDNSKIKSYVPEYQAVIPFHQGIRRTLAWFDAKPERKWIDEKAEEEMEDILRAYQAFG